MSFFWFCVISPKQSFPLNLHKNNPEVAENQQMSRVRQGQLKHLQWLKQLSEVQSHWTKNCLVFGVTADISAKHDKAKHVFSLLSPHLWPEGLQGLPDTIVEKNPSYILSEYLILVQLAMQHCSKRRKANQMNCGEMRLLWFCTGMVQQDCHFSVSGLHKPLCTVSFHRSIHTTHLHGMR